MQRGNQHYHYTRDNKNQPDSHEVVWLSDRHIPNKPRHDEAPIKQVPSNKYQETTPRVHVGLQPVGPDPEFDKLFTHDYHRLATEREHSKQRRFDSEGMDRQLLIEAITLERIKEKEAKRREKEMKEIMKIQKEQERLHQWWQPRRF